MQPGTTLYLSPREKHKFVNQGTEPLRFFWVLMLGLSDFFKAIGKPRTAANGCLRRFHVQMTLGRSKQIPSSQNSTETRVAL